MKRYLYLNLLYNGHFSVRSWIQGNLLRKTSVIIKYIIEPKRRV